MPFHQTQILTLNLGFFTRTTKKKKTKNPPPPPLPPQNLLLVSIMPCLSPKGCMAYIHCIARWMACTGHTHILAFVLEDWNCIHVCTDANLCSRCESSLRGLQACVGLPPGGRGGGGSTSAIQLPTHEYCALQILAKRLQPHCKVVKIDTDKYPNLASRNHVQVRSLF